VRRRGGEGRVEEEEEERGELGVELGWERWGDQDGVGWSDS
jgi:hypothetical protein